MNKQLSTLHTSFKKNVASPRFGLLWATVLLVAAVAVLPFYAWPVSAQSNSPLERPAQPAAIVITHDSVTISWADPGDSGITGYRILRRNADAGEHFLSIYVSDTGSDMTSYTDSGVAAGTRYVYRVRAINEVGVGAKSTRVVITTSG